MERLHILRSRNLPPSPHPEGGLMRLAHERWGRGLWFEGEIGKPENEIWLTLVVGGKLSVRLGDSAVRALSPPALHVTRQGARRDDALGVADGDFCELLCFVFRGNGPLHALGSALPPRTQVFPVRNPSVLRDLFALGLSLLDEGDHASSLPPYEALLLNALRRSLQTDPSRSQKGLHHYRRCLELIDSLPIEELSVARLADRLHLNRSALSRLFRAQHGDTLASHLSRRRLNHGVNLLRSSEATIDTIGRACGFADGFSFTKAFTRFYKINPSAYRRL